MMLRSKHILFIIFLFVGAQCVASQSVVLDSVAVDTIETVVPIDTINVVDSVELADAEFEEWLEKYAQVIDNREPSIDERVEEIDSCLQDSVEKRDFVRLIDEGEEAREREKNALIMKVMASLKEKKDEVENREQRTENREQRTENREQRTDDREQMTDDGVRIVDKLAELDNLSFLTPDSLLSEVDIVLSGEDFRDVVNPIFLDWVLGTLPAVSQSLDDEDSVVISVRTQAKNYVKSNAPELYAYHRDELPEISELKIEHMHQGKREKLLLNLDSLNRARTSQLSVELPEISKWSKGAKFQVHISQNYITPNWYKGGESNLASTFYALGYFNYNNRKGLQWDNKVEWKLGLYGMASDSLRWLRVNEDLLRLNSKLGYKAFKNFYYTAEWDFQTSFFNTYKSNTYIRSSGPFSPIRMSLSLGMDYKYKKVVSVFVSPLSYKLVYVADMSYKEGVLPEENIAYQIGITDGTRQSNQLGALVRTDFDYDFNESIGMEVHFSFFGNYVGKIKGVEVGCEVIGNFKINRYFSAKVSLYPRYDSTTIPADGGKPKMQFYELISLGFNYKL